MISVLATGEPAGFSVYTSGAIFPLSSTTPDTNHVLTVTTVVIAAGPTSRRRDENRLH